MSNIVKIHRPTNRRDQWDADEHTLRSKIYEAVIPQIQKERGGEHVAELMFHILNAPKELLSEQELDIAYDFADYADMYSLSTGDVVEVDGEHFLCESFGWRKIENPIYPLVNHS